MSLILPPPILDYIKALNTFPPQYCYISSRGIFLPCALMSSSTCSLTSSAFFGVPSPGAPVSLTLSTHHCLTSVSSQLYALAMSGVSEPCLRQEKHCILYVCHYSKRETESVKEKLLKVNSRHLLLSMAHVGVQSKEIKAIIQKGAVPGIQSLAPVSCLLPVWCKPWVSLSRQGTKFCQKTDFIALASSSVEIGQEMGRPLKKIRLCLWSPASPQMLPATELTDLVLIAFFSLLMPFANMSPGCCLQNKNVAIQRIWGRQTEIHFSSPLT